MADKYYSIREVADRLNVKWYRIKYSHMAGLVPERNRLRPDLAESRVVAYPCS